MLKTLLAFILAITRLGGQSAEIPTPIIKAPLIEDFKGKVAILEATNRIDIPQTATSTEIAIITELGGETGKENNHLCSCVAHSRIHSPYQPPKVKQASEIPAIRFTPKVGGWVLMNIPPYGHSAVVTKILGDKIEITESNYPIPCKENTRIISIYDKTIRGYFWHDLW